MRPVVLVATALTCMTVTLGACGSRAGDDVGVDPGADGAGAGAGAGRTELTVEVDPGPGSGKATRSFTLVCDPPGGSHPDAEAACRLLERLDDPFAPVPPDTACAELYGGPQTARVTGTFRGERVDARFSRVDGCQIDRWERHGVLLVEPGGVEGP